MTRPLLVAALGAALVTSFGLSACATKEDTGTLAGAVVGGIIGNQFGKGSGKVAATFAGAVIGGIVGNEIGRKLDARDRELARQAEFEAWERGAPGKAVRWSNPDNGRRGAAVTSSTVFGLMAAGSRCAAPPAAIPTALGPRSADPGSRGAGCELTLTHEIDAKWAQHKDRTEPGWTTILAHLAASLG
jgi:surface antigen